MTQNKKPSVAANEQHDPDAKTKERKFKPLPEKKGEIVAVESHSYKHLPNIRGR